MRTLLEQEDIQAIADEIIIKLRPIFAQKVKNKPEDTILNVEGLADYLKASKKWVYERTHFNEIPFLKINGLLRFRKKDIDKWIEGQSVPQVNDYKLKIIKK